MRESQRRWNNSPEGKHSIKISKIKYQYKMEYSSYLHMLEEQGYCCALCHQPLSMKASNHHPLSPAIDHDHRCCSVKNRCCGQCVRGVIHRQCNLSLGGFRDDAEVLQLAINYLESPMTVDEIWDQF